MMNSKQARHSHKRCTFDTVPSFYIDVGAHSTIQHAAYTDCSYAALSHTAPASTIHCPPSSTITHQHNLHQTPPPQIPSLRTQDSCLHIRCNSTLKRFRGPTTRPCRVKVAHSSSQSQAVDPGYYRLKSMGSTRVSLTDLRTIHE
jgi:hypothetical protein